MTNVIGFNSFILNGCRHYGCRGYGLKYDAFYEWVHTISYKSTSSDWPWDYFFFTDFEDEIEFLRRYGSDIDYQTDD